MNSRQRRRLLRQITPAVHKEYAIGRMSTPMSTQGAAMYRVLMEDFSNNKNSTVDRLDSAKVLLRDLKDNFYS